MTSDQTLRDHARALDRIEDLEQEITTLRRDAETAASQEYNLLAANLDRNPPNHLDHDTLYHGDSAFMTRYYIVRGRTANMRLHHILRSDAERDMHDHPWDFTSHLLSGGYREFTPDGVADYWAPAVLHRKATDVHRIELLAGPMWTLIITGPWLKPWGFYTANGFVPWQQYHATLLTHGEGATDGP